jgi:hypothetical protein
MVLACRSFEKVLLTSSLDDMSMLTTKWTVGCITVS